MWLVGARNLYCCGDSVIEWSQSPILSIFLWCWLKLSINFVNKILILLVYAHLWKDPPKENTKNQDSGAKLCTISPRDTLNEETIQTSEITKRTMLTVVMPTLKGCYTLALWFWLFAITGCITNTCYEDIF
jgi:hypothetical protein